MEASSPKENGSENPVRVALLGPLHSYSHLAASEHFGARIEPRPEPTIAAVFEAVVRGRADFGVAPRATAADGEIAETAHQLAVSPVRECGELTLAIHHQLLARCEISQVREVYSRQQALSQCRRWLAANLPGVKRIEVSSTAQAARLVQNLPHAAAIASRQAGIAYQLDLLAANIEDRPDNLTRFVVFK